MRNYTKLLHTIKESLSLREHIVKRGDKWVVTSSDGSKTMGSYDSKEAAEKRLREIEYFKNEDVPGWKQVAVMEDDDEQNGAYFTCPSCHYEFPGKAGGTAPCPLCGGTARFTASIHEGTLTERDSNRGQAYLVTLAGAGGREETKTIYALTPADARAKVKALGDKVLDVETIANDEMTEAVGNMNVKDVPVYMSYKDAKNGKVAAYVRRGAQSPEAARAVGAKRAEYSGGNFGEFKPGWIVITEAVDVPEDQVTEDAEDGDPTPDCPFCGGEGIPMGTLGTRTFYRCRNCGGDYSVQGMHTESVEGSGYRVIVYPKAFGRGDPTLKVGEQTFNSIEDAKAWAASQSNRTCVIYNPQNIEIMRINETVGMPATMHTEDFKFDLNPGGKAGKQFEITCGNCGKVYHVTGVGVPNAKCPKCGSTKHTNVHQVDEGVGMPGTMQVDKTQNESFLDLFHSNKTYAMVRSPWGNSQTKKEIKRGEDGNLYALTDRGWNRLTTDDYGQLYLTNEDLATNAKPEEDDGTDLGNDIYSESWSGMVLNDQLNRMGQQLNEATAMEFVRKLKNLNVQVGISIVRENDIVHLILDGPPDGVRDATDMANDDGLTTERTLPMKGGTHRVIVSGFGR